jgi:hypothetical protein
MSIIRMAMRPDFPSSMPSKIVCAKVGARQRCGRALNHATKRKSLSVNGFRVTRIFGEKSRYTHHRIQCAMG